MFQIKFTKIFSVLIFSLTILSNSAFIHNLFIIQTDPIINKEVNIKSKNAEVSNTIKPDFFHPKGNLNSNNIFHTYFNITSSPNYFDGYNMFVLEELDKETLKISNRAFLITDMYGNILHKLHLNLNYNIGYLTSEFINSTTVLLGTPEGAKLWNYYTNTTTSLGFIGHHEYEYNSINNTYFTMQVKRIDINGTIYVFDTIKEFNNKGELVWLKETTDFISINQWCPYHDMYGDNIDLTHGNTLFYDSEEDIIYYNPRNLNTFYKIEHSTGKVLWGLGEFGNFTLYDKYGNPKTNLFYHPHAIEKIDENRFILFDNDYHNQTNTSDKCSRILEIELNTKTMTANVTRDWISPQEYYSRVYGDADLLPNGDRLGTFGTENHGSFKEIGARIVEVTINGKLVWEMNFPNSANHCYRIYRTERIRFNPIIEPKEDIIVARNQDIIIEWKTWYNFRTKSHINGSYEIYLNDSLIETGIHTFNKFWKSSNLTVNIGKIPNGNYNLKAIIYDEAGHSSEDTIGIKVTDFYIERKGSTDIEQGLGDSPIQWSGVTSSILTYKIFINNTLFQTNVWSSNITIELNSNLLLPGKHSVQFLLYNETTPIYNDSFMIIIHPISPPSFISFPTDQMVVWNQSLILTWEIFDYTPQKWKLTINNSLYYSEQWLNKSQKITWEIPILNESKYNITLILYDKADLIAFKSVWITIIPPRPPIILFKSYNNQIVWNQDEFLNWEVHGGNNWNIWNNGSLVGSGTIENNFLSFCICRWEDNNWLPGNHNITLVVTNDFGEKAFNTQWINIILAIGNAYANEVVLSSSAYYTNGSSSLGPPDGIYASIFYDYSNGYITLDMGENEEILDGEGKDFIVYAIGNYFVWVSNDLSAPFLLLDGGINQQSFDLHDISLTKARYIKIECISEESVKLDAVKAMYFNQVNIDNNPPSIVGPQDFWVWKNVSSITLLWIVEDLTPWNYSIYIENTIAESGKWDGSNIIFNYFITKAGNITFTLKLFDIFSNFAEDTVTIEIRELNDNEIEKSTYIIFLSFLILGILSKVKRKRFKFDNKFSR
ncbi:MAG: aryl-sulfate sulfotransferase [Candidatus Heimdallarchaeaceae archaeon]